MSEKKCDKCGKKIEDNVVLHRVNKGEVPSIWRCSDCCSVTGKEIDKVTLEICNVINGDK
ncbi:MAG: hypothetical protein WC343_11260 [Bacilli bacterium]|jgi:hypothetical protein